jgi:predicted metal-dependent phosphotriesterase family hydrolase
MPELTAAGISQEALDNMLEHNPDAILAKV